MVGQSGKRRKDTCLCIPLDLQIGYGMQMLSHCELAARSRWCISVTIMRSFLHQPHLYGALFPFEADSHLLLTEFLEKICFLLEITINNNYYHRCNHYILCCFYMPISLNPCKKYALLLLPFYCEKIS